MINLDHCIKKYFQTEDNNIDIKLGNKWGNYLVHSQTKGWEVVHLNFFQQLFRKYFGCYKETHSTTVAKHLQSADNKETAAQHAYLRDRFLPVVKLITFAVGGKFNPLGVATKQTYEEHDTKVKEAKKGFPVFSPEFKGDPKFPGISFETQNDDLAEVTKVAQEKYTAYLTSKGITSGPFNDQIHILKTSPRHYEITQIANSAFPKPGLAADIIPVFKAKNKFFVLTGTRMAEPGKGKNATLGGFTGIEAKDKTSPASTINPYVLDSDLYTALKEGKEEGNLRIFIKDIAQYREIYDADHVEGSITCGKDADLKEFKATVIRLGTIKTSDAMMAQGGELLSDGTKRVYATTGFAVMVDLGDMEVNIADKVNDAFLKKFKFSAADDIKGLQINDITNAVLDPSEENMEKLAKQMEFGINHHNDLMRLSVGATKKFFSV